MGIARMETRISPPMLKKAEKGGRRDQGVISDLRKLELEQKAAPEALKGAAIRVEGKVFVEMSHALAYAKARLELGTDVVDKALGKHPRDFQGFVTTQGRFVTRKEAVEVADKAKQLSGGRKPKAMGIEDMEFKEFQKMSRKLEGEVDP